MRKRSSDRAHWPDYLNVRKKPCGLYYSWKHPETGKEYAIGYVSEEEAIAQAAGANKKVKEAVKKQTFVEKLAAKEAKIAEEIRQKLSLTPQPFKRLTGVYFLFLSGEIVYIGQSINIMKRLIEHDFDGKVFDSFGYLEFEKKYLNYEERRLIKLYRPRYNITYNDES